MFYILFILQTIQHNNNPDIILSTSFFFIYIIILILLHHIPVYLTMPKRIGRRSSMVSIRSSTSKLNIPNKLNRRPSFDHSSNNAKILEITSVATPSPTARSSNKFPRMRRRASAPDLRHATSRLSISPLASPAVRRKQREQLSKVVEIIIRQYTDILTNTWLHWKRYLKLLHIFELKKVLLFR